jgi:TolB-like protein/Tfp pilus assembly protein PilF
LRRLPEFFSGLNLFSKRKEMNDKIFYIIFSIIIMSANISPASARNLSILVSPFENTGDEKYSWISAGMSDSIIADLNKIDNIIVLSEKDRKSALKEIEAGQTGMISLETAVQAGEFTGADVVFTGSYAVFNNQIRVIAKLVRVETGEIEKTAKIDGTLDRIFDVQDKVVIQLMSDAGKIQFEDIDQLAFGDAEQNKITEKERPPVDAYEFYSKGLEIQDENPQQALAYYSDAINIDNGYYGALNRSGEVYVAARQYDTALVFYERAHKSLKKRGFQDTVYFLTLMDNIGNAYRYKGDNDRALEYYKRGKNKREKIGLKNTSGYISNINNIGAAHRGKGERDEAVRHFNESGKMMDRMGAGKTRAYNKTMNNIGDVHKSMGNHGEAKRYYDRGINRNKVNPVRHRDNEVKIRKKDIMIKDAAAPKKERKNPETKQK